MLDIDILVFRVKVESFEGMLLVKVFGFVDEFVFIIVLCIGVFF